MAEGELLVDRLGALAVVRLNRPKAINALSLTMLETLGKWLERFRDDPGVSAILLRGEGERGFCAGGDVRAVREAVLAGRPGDVKAYFETEYRVDGLVGGLEKPVIAIQHGVVMGGGIGLSAHAGLRIGVPGARFAMPEPAIGFFGDVGVNFALREAPAHRALAFLMSGMAVGVADAMALGLCDVAVREASLDALVSGLATAAGSENPRAALLDAARSLAEEAGPAEFVAGADALESEFAAGDGGAIVAGVAAAAGRLETGFVTELAAALRSGCPTSIEANRLHHLAMRNAGTLAGVLAADLKLAMFMVGRADFSEGVRAVLVDKDRSPKWHPGILAAVDLDALGRAVGGIDTASSV